MRLWYYTVGATHDPVTNQFPDPARISRRLSNRMAARESKACSDGVLRGLGYKDGPVFPDGVNSLEKGSDLS